MNFGSGGGGATGGGAGNATAGPDLDQIETEQLAFQSASGEAKLRLLPSAWPTDHLPPNTSSLLSVASTKGLLAAAAPDTLVIASTESVRQTLIDGAADENKVKSFTPQATISIPRVSQVAFSSDESCLVIAAEQGGGLAVYDTTTLTNGGKEPAFQLATEGQSVRQLLPNPNWTPSADLSRYFGIVTENGQLLLADLKEQKLVPSSSGSAVFHENVSCACWSRLGKQIVAGLADGTAVQIDQQGVVKASIPEPPQLAEWKQNSSAVAHPITSIFWLDTHDFLIIHTPINQGIADGMPNDDSIYHLAHRDKQSQAWTFSKFIDPSPPFGMESRKPAHHFILRLREWLSLNDLLILSSTASTDIGIFTRSKQPLDAEHPVADVFTYTQPPDSRRAAMPMGSEGADTSPVGMAIDLSVKEKAPRPIPTDETLEESPVPLPALYVLDNEGGLSMWYVIYNESIRQGKAYEDLVAAGGPRPLGGESRPPSQPQPQQQAVAQNAPSVSSPFGASANASTSPFGMPQQQATSTFGTPSQPKSTFGQPSQSSSTFGQPSTPAFGGVSSIGNRQSPWATSGTGATSGSAFGKPAFGSSTFGQPSAFGQPGGGMGMNKGSVWGSPQSSQQQQQGSQQASTFGSGGVFGGNASQSSPFMSLGGNQTQNQNQNQSPFASAGKTASLSNQSSSSSSGFASLGKSTTQPQQSPFASKPSLPAEPSGSTISFGSGMSFGSGSSNFGVHSLASPAATPTQQQAQSREESMQDDEDERSETSTLKPASQRTASDATVTQGGGGGLFGLPAGGFKLGSTFKPDGSAKDDLPKPKDTSAAFFGKNFGDALALSDSSTADAKKDKDGSRSGSEAAWWSGRSTPVVKKEPGTEEVPKLESIPPAASQGKEPKKVEERAASPADDAPLPPDPTTWKPKPGALPAPVPPGFDFGKPKAKQAEQATPPAAPTSPAVNKQKESGEPLAGSPPVDLGGAKFSADEASPTTTSEEAAGPPESEDEEGDYSDEYEDEGDVGSDEAEDDVDDDEENRTPQVIEDPKGLSAFEARLTPADSKKGQGQQHQKPSPSPSQQQQKSTTPATEPKKDSYTPAGMPKPPIMFQAPQRNLQQSPRSPSPQRSVTSPARAMPPNFGAAPQGTALKGSTFGKPSTIPQQQQQQSLSQPSQLPPPSQPRTSSLLQGTNEASRTTSQSRTPSSSQPQRIAVPPAQLVSKQRSPTPAKPAEPEEGELEDEEDARIQAILASPAEPTSEVPAFLAHQDYVASGREKEGLGGQIERVFRDINSMIDTLALNARALRGFVEGNSEAQQARSRLDLEEEEGWVLGEAVELEGIMEGIDVELEDGKLEDVRGAMEGLRDDEREMSRLRVKCAEVRKQIAARSDPNQLAQQLAAPLPLETQTLQSELRQGAQRVQELLAKAEEQLSVLRAELASVPSKAASGEGGRSAVPTVEAVTNTILKMTAMIEKRSGDIDVLEAQIRRLGGPAAIGLKENYEDELAAGLKASRLSSPTALNKSSSGRASMYGSPAASRVRAALGGAARNTPSPGSAFGRKSLFDVPDAEVEAYRLRKEGRRKAVELLREQLDVRGVRVVRVGR